MDTWGVIGGLLIFFAPALGRLHWIARIIAIAVGVVIMVFAGASFEVGLGVSGLVSTGSSYLYNKITGEMEIIDIVGYIIGIGLIILSFVVA